jgi:ATP-binding cassette subfamily F protein 3
VGLFFIWRVSGSTIGYNHSIIMAILTTSGVGQSFGSFDVFLNVTVSVPNNGKIGLVGPNGIGKTTLLLILAGLVQPSTGSINWARGTRLGYLPQEAAQAFAGLENNVYDEMLAQFAQLHRDEARLRQMEAEMGTGNPSDLLLEKYGTALEQFELDGGYDYETRIQQVLQGLGFGKKDWGLKLSHLSGGQKTRALLGRLLLEKPDLLIIDEPTNHLDVSAIEWLENTLRTWDGALVVVSHDRYFLDKIADTIWEMRRDGIETYRGNYSAYLQQREARWERRLKGFEARRERLNKELDFVRRNIAGQRGQMAKGKLSRISRELHAIQRGGVEAIEGKSWSETSNQLGGLSRYSMSVAEATEAIQNLQKPDGSYHNFKIKMKSSQRSGNLVLRTKDLEIGYPGNRLFVSDDIELHRLECGSGKTTFIKSIIGQLEPLGGHIQHGASVKIGYFAQAHEQLNPENRIIDELLNYHEMAISQARSYLAQYLFRRDDVFKPVHTLSGGERGRLALAILALEEANVLLLDEPTNHLDIPAQEMLQKVLTWLLRYGNWKRVGLKFSKGATVNSLGREIGLLK